MRFIWELIARISFRSASEVIWFMWTLKVQWRAQSFLVPGWFIFSLDIEGHYAHGPAAPKLVTSESPKLINLPLTTIHLDSKLVFCYKIPCPPSYLIYVFALHALYVVNVVADADSCSSCSRLSLSPYSKSTASVSALLSGWWLICWRAWNDNEMLATRWYEQNH